MMKRVLIIDDNEQIRNVMNLMLSKAGYEVVLAENGNVGIKKHQARPMDLIITDILMPEKEGLETIIELRKTSPNLKIIGMSGGGQNAGLSYLPVAGKIGANATLTKPFSREELLRLVEETLKA